MVKKIMNLVRSFVIEEEEIVEASDKNGPERATKIRPAIQ